MQDLIFIILCFIGVMYLFFKVTSFMNKLLQLMSSLKN